ncbi:hypothetical protein K3495_g5558 [Podosphaera aphanis]|nr:hypothetical protein K3495_g5558 [Podosphaera aphanis]
MAKLSLTTFCFALSLTFVNARYVFYYDHDHPNPPNRTITAGIDHVVVTGASSSLFTTSPAGKYTPFEDINSVRSHFDDGAKVSISVGSWDDTAGFVIGAATEDSRKLFATNIAALIKESGVDGIDINWQYPGGNGHDYRQVPNSKKVSEIDTYPLLLAEIRSAIGQEKLLTIAAPGNIRDMIAYTPEKAPSIWESVDWVNVMTYDLMTRRDNVTTHHTDVKKSLETIDYYINVLKLDPKKTNLGFAMYSKWFSIDSTQTCEKGLGCATELLEDADGTDTRKSASMTFEASNYAVSSTNLTESVDNTCGPAFSTFCPESMCCSAYGFCGNTETYCQNCQGAAYGSGCTDLDLKTMFQTAMRNGLTDETTGGHYYFDQANNRFWTWETPELISRKFTEIVAARNLGGVMGWGLGLDSHDFSHIIALQKGVAGIIEAERKEVERKEAEKKASPLLKPIGGRLRYGSTLDDKNQGIINTSTSSKAKSWISSWWGKLWGN